MGRKTMKAVDIGLGDVGCAATAWFDDVGRQDGIICDVGEDASCSVHFLAFADTHLTRIERTQIIEVRERIPAM